MKPQQQQHAMARSLPFFGPFMGLWMAAGWSDPSRGGAEALLASAQKNLTVLVDDLHACTLYVGTMYSVHFGFRVENFDDAENISAKLRSNPLW